MAAHKTTHCPHGHDIAEVGRNSTGHCKACACDYAKRRYAANIDRLRLEHAENSRLDRQALAASKGVTNRAR